jgi:hypothetical protein
MHGVDPVVLRDPALPIQVKSRIQAGFRRDCEYERKGRLHLRLLAADACISDQSGMRKTIGGDNDDIDAVRDLDGRMTDHTTMPRLAARARLGPTSPD